MERGTLGAGLQTFVRRGRQGIGIGTVALVAKRSS